MRKNVITFLLIIICTLTLSSQSLSKFFSINNSNQKSQITPFSTVAIVNNPSVGKANSLFTTVSYGSYGFVNDLSSYRIVDALVAKNWTNQGLILSLHNQGFSSSKLSEVTLSYSRILADNSALAISYNYLNFWAKNESSKNIGSLNLSGYYSPLQSLSFALVIEHLLPHFDEAEQNIDWMIGSSWKLSDLIILHAVIEQRNLKTSLQFSSEYIFSESIIIKIGVRLPSASPSLGISFQIKNHIYVQMSFAYQPSFGLPFGIGLTYDLVPKLDN